MAKKGDDLHQAHRDKLKALANKLARKHGRGVLMAADSNPFSDIDWLPTGIFALDNATGGGFPRGRISGLFGEASGGKSFLALKTVAASQLVCRKHYTLMDVNYDKPLLRCPVCGSRGEEPECPKCSKITKSASTKVIREDRGDYEMTCKECGFYNPHRAYWMDMEGVYTNSWAATLGIDSEYVDISRPEYAEQAVDVYELTLRELDVDIAVIDSIAALTPLAEIQDTAEKAVVGGQARIVNRLMRQAVSIQNSDALRKEGRRLTQIFINQMRDKIGIMFGDPSTRPAGRGQEFVSSLDVRMRSSKTHKEDDEPYVALLKFFITKNKTGMPAQRSGAFRLWLQDYDDRPKGWTNEPLVVARAMHRVGLGLAPGDKVEIIDAVALAHEEMGTDDPPDPSTAVGLAIRDEVILALSETADRIEKHLPSWWEARTRLFKERVGKVEEDLKDASR